MILNRSTLAANEARADGGARFDAEDGVDKRENLTEISIKNYSEM